MKRAIFAGALACLGVGFIALGVWQLERRAWKLNLIATVDARVHAPAKVVDEWSSLTAADAYRHVTVTGVFRNDRETLVQAVTERGPGWWVLTPLSGKSGTILVNRGFVPTERKHATSHATIEGQASVTGLVRASEPHGGFLRRNDPSSDRWYSRDVAAIARARGLTQVASVFIDADATPNPGGYPVGGLTVVAFRNAHLVYAITWFALAALSAWGMIVVLRSQPRRIENGLEEKA